MTGCDFFEPIQKGKEDGICSHYDSFKEHNVTLDPVTMLNAHGVGFYLGERQIPPLVVVPKHWVAVTDHILYEN